jgi:divalent metal cation (Fe/Co/Zn/Cd) transporter
VLIGLLALTVAALFTGAAFYVNFAEQPARLKLDDRALLAESKPAYRRGFIMQASLAVIGFLLGAGAWWQTGIIAFLIGGLVILANWPWTLLVIKPVNDALMETPLEKARPQTRRLVEKWGMLHAFRTGFGALSVAIFLAGLIDLAREA